MSKIKIRNKLHKNKKYKNCFLKKKKKKLTWILN